MKILLAKLNISDEENKNHRKNYSSKYLLTWGSLIQCWDRVLQWFAEIWCPWQCHDNRTPPRQPSPGHDATTPQASTQHIEIITQETQASVTRYRHVTKFLGLKHVLVIERNKMLPIYVGTDLGHSKLSS